MSETCAQCGLLQQTQKFLAQPFTSAASNTSWVLFVGLVIIVAYLWRDIIKHIESMV
jgi:hypothetical protein